VSGFWHGANWTFIVWGMIHAMLFLPLLLLGRNRTYVLSTKIYGSQVPKIILTFLVITLAWIFFRADSVNIAYQYIINLFSFNSSSVYMFYKTSKMILFSTIIIFSIIILLLFEFLAIQNNKKEVQLTTYSAIFIVILICFMGVFKNPSEFIYFQF